MMSSLLKDLAEIGIAVGSNDIKVRIIIPRFASQSWKGSFLGNPEEWKFVARVLYIPINLILNISIFILSYALGTLSDACLLHNDI